MVALEQVNSLSLLLIAPWLMVLCPFRNKLFSAAVKWHNEEHKIAVSEAALCLKIWQVCAFSICFLLFWYFLRVIHWYWMMLFFVERIKICLCLSSGEFFPACFSNWSRDICCFEICICSSLAFFPLLSDDVVMSLGHLLSANCPEREPGQENEEKKIQTFKEYRN